MNALRAIALALAVAGLVAGQPGKAAAVVSQALPPVPIDGEGAAVADPPSSAAATRQPILDVIRRVENPEMRIAITFDACATRGQPNGFDRPLYRVLQREQLPATLFVSGRWAESHPRVMQELAADPLIEFANHSYDHPHMPALSDSEIAEQLDRTEAALALYGQHSVAFRPPFGTFNDRVLEIARDRRLPAVLWDVVSGDPSVGATADAIIRTVVRDTRSGSIVIFHINGRETQTASALPSILRKLRARGFQFVHVSTLLASGPNTTHDPHAFEEYDGVLPLAADGVSLEPPARAINRSGEDRADRPRLVPAMAAPAWRGGGAHPAVLDEGQPSPCRSAAAGTACP